MSHSYQHGSVPDDIRALVTFMREELGRLEQALNAAQEASELNTLHAAPKRIRPGMLVLADGTDWQPDGVNGEGLYRRNEANDAWVFIG